MEVNGTQKVLTDCLDKNFKLKFWPPINFNKVKLIVAKLVSI